MSSTGSWFPVATGPTSVSLYGPGGRAELTYSGLTVTDATGRHLAAHLETSGRSIRIAFDDQGAQYPVVVDPWIQVAGLVPPAYSNAFGKRWPSRRARRRPRPSSGTHSVGHRGTAR